MDLLVRECGERDILYLHSRTGLINFYASFGFSPHLQEGTPEDDPGAVHLPYRRGGSPRDHAHEAGTGLAGRRTSADVIGVILSLLLPVSLCSFSARSSRSSSGGKIRRSAPPRSRRPFSGRPYSREPHSRCSFTPRPSPRRSGRCSPGIDFTVVLDRLSALFLLILGVVGIADAVYSFGYVEHCNHPIRRNLLVSLMNLFILSMGDGDPRRNHGSVPRLLGDDGDCVALPRPVRR
ncbi:hypothetical protein [Methanoculleus chikugoensis]|uniref:hypothetical protein n=1 Tax=Methanoculleus chikugoensis TaxID=118126 RepID=UPI0006CF55A7|nr:hypothetical protein [Methanoculleus chikugoensis]